VFDVNLLGEGGSFEGGSGWFSSRSQPSSIFPLTSIERVVLTSS
jgi:hypothetical protein